MTGHERLCELLPLLYRPEPDDETLLNRLLIACGAVLDDARVQVQHVLRAHWFDTADSALWDAHYQIERAERRLPAVNVRDAEDVKEVLAYPYVSDLARVVGLLNLPPWLEPVSARETVEEYRQRARDLVDAYRLGLTTVRALRRLTEAALPERMDAPLAQQRWPFAVEEPVALETQRTQVTVADAEAGDVIGPLFRWGIEALGTPIVHLQGAGSGPTVQPAIEGFTPGENPAGVALGYRGTLAPGQTLRIAPARRTWLTIDGALRVSPEESSSNVGNDPSANGPWDTVPEAPVGQVRCVGEALDHTLWLAVENAGSWGLFRYDGAEFAGVTDGAPSGPYLALLAHGAAVYLGTERGLFKCPLYPESGSRELAAVPAVSGSVHALVALPDGRLACASDDGLVVLDDNDAISMKLLSGVDVRIAYVDRGRTYLGTEKALLLWDHQQLHRYEGAGLTENANDWVAISETDAPGAASPIPEVTAMATTPDGSLWLGTVRGLARYYVDEHRTTLLEAYPDLGGGAVHNLYVDDRGMLWIASEDGLYRYDGRDIAQYSPSEHLWSSLGAASTVYPDEISASPRGHFRYAAAQDRWEHFDAALSRFTTIDLDRRSEASANVASVLATSTIRAELGTFDGTNFSPQESVATSQFVMRIKPDETRIENGGIPGLPAGSGTLRYLELEPSDLVPPPGRPWWSTEGRLFPPPNAEAPWPGRFRDENSAWSADGHFDQAMFAYPPSVRIWLEYASDPPIGVRVRVFKRTVDEDVDSSIIERVWQLLSRAKAAGVPLELAVEGAVVKPDKGG